MIEKGKDTNEADLKSMYQKIIGFFVSLIDLQTGIDKEGTIINIKNNKRVAGANAWLLMSSIMIASLGLDLNSAAVLIGAMLISPLMSPILGIGLAIGTNDRETLKVSLQHFGISIGIALITSVIYFAINPLGQLEATEQILARTEPNLLDGLVAVFGGIAGIISSSRKDKSNAIPGVAIATALMPPLCVAGYGIAKGDWIIFSNAFYLFFLNSFLIAASTWMMIRLMHFPKKSFQDAKIEARTRLYMIAFTIAITAPSAYLLYNTYLDRQNEFAVKRFVNNNFGETSDPQAIDFRYTEGKDSSILAMQLIGRDLERVEIEKYEHLAGESGIPHLKIYAIQDKSLDLSRFDLLQKELEGFKNISNQLEQSVQNKDLNETKIQYLEQRLDSLHADTIPLRRIFEEAKLAFPEIKNLAYGKLRILNDSSKYIDQSMLYVTWEKNTNSSAKRKLKDRIAEYLTLRIDKTAIKIEWLDS